MAKENAIRVKIARKGGEEGLKGRGGKKEFNRALSSGWKHTRGLSVGERGGYIIIIGGGGRESSFSRGGFKELREGTN